MTVYDVYTKEVNGKWITEPILLETFNSFEDTYSYLKKYAQDCNIPLAISFFRSSADSFMRGKSKTFGVGAKRYCLTREV